MSGLYNSGVYRVLDNTTLEKDPASNLIRVKDLGISTAKIANLAVTAGKLAALNYAISSSTGGWTTANTTFQLVKSMSFTSNGRPVWVSLIGDPSTLNQSFVRVGRGSSTIPAEGEVELRIDGTPISTQAIRLWSGTAVTQLAVTIPASSFSAITIASSANHTYTVYARVVNGTAGENIDINEAKLLVIEL